MVSLVISGFMWYSAFLGLTWYGSTLDGTLGNAVFWFFFALSSFTLFRLCASIRELFINLFAKCHQVDKAYIDEEMKKYEEKIKIDS